MCASVAAQSFATGLLVRATTHRLAADPKSPAGSAAGAARSVFGIRRPRATTFVAAPSSAMPACQGDPPFAPTAYPVLGELAHQSLLATRTASGVAPYFRSPQSLPYPRLPVKGLLSGRALRPRKTDHAFPAGRSRGRRASITSIPQPDHSTTGHTLCQVVIIGPFPAPIPTRGDRSLRREAHHSARKILCQVCAGRPRPGGMRTAPTAS